MGVADPVGMPAGFFRRPFGQQVAFFRQKLGRLVPTARWDDLLGAQHDSAFVVAGAMKADLLADLAASVDRSITEGKSLDAFRKDFNAAVDRHNWHGWTGEETKGGRAWRTRTIYRTNASVSYAAGRRAQLVAGNFAFWVYRHGGSLEPRPEHLAFDGIALPPDHPFWEKFYPPSDWGCSCYVIGARSAAGIRRLGGDPDKRLPDDWDKIVPATGEPAGIGKGWGHAPGATIPPSTWAAAEKLRHWDYAIGKAFLGELPDAARDSLSTAYRSLPSVADDARRYARRALGDGGEAVVQPTWTLGAVRSDQAAAFADHFGTDTKAFDFSMDRFAIEHVREQHGNAKSEAARGQLAIDAGDYAILPDIINYGRPAPAGVSKRTGNPLVAIAYRMGRIEYVAVFELRKGKRTLALQTFYARGSGAE
ncbi:phage minor head protein [Sphingomonas panni]|uniref:phage minor head protein n=1 Tax=Sphingomonas panni TaxID=237612 RepID=UPI001F5B8EE0|nr:phage minor head protein [Sphingomonas panni]